MNPHLTDALARLNERRGVHWGSKVQALTERDLAPKTRKAIDGLTEAFELELKDDGRVYLVKPGSAIDADAATPKSAAPEWMQTINAAFDALELAQTYADDGAYKTAARRAEAAANLFRLGFAQRSIFTEAKAVGQ